MTDYAKFLESKAIRVTERGMIDNIAGIISVQVDGVETPAP